jgi:esterase/lipase superfamily enzyme
MQRVVNTASNESDIVFGQVLLAAPDVDRDVFRDLATLLAQCTDRVTLCVSPKDMALGLSHWLHEYPRAGLSPPVTVVDGVDTIEVPKFNLLDLGHAYFAEAEAVLHDMFDLTRQNTPPSKRLRLFEAETETSEKYWRLMK